MTTGSVRAGLAFAVLGFGCAGGADAGTPSPAIDYQAFVTLDTSEGACASANQIVVTAAEDVQAQFCFRVRNTGDVVFNVHDVTTSLSGRIFSHAPATLAPGEETILSQLVTTVEDLVLLSSWTAKDVAPGYTNTPGTYDYLDIAASGTALDLNGYFAGAAITVPFEFTFYGVRSDRLTVCNFGAILFDRSASGCGYYSLPLPTYRRPLTLLPFNELLHYDRGGVYHQTIGSAPNRRFIVQWRRNRQYTPELGDGVEFQAVLNEADDTVVFQYEDVVFGEPAYDFGGRATIGLSYDAELAHQYSHETPSVGNGQAILWTPTPMISATGSGAAAVIVQAPGIDVDAAELSLALAPEQIAQRQLSILSNGEATLTWRVDGAASNSTAHIPRQPRRVVPAGRSPLSGWVDGGATLEADPTPAGASGNLPAAYGTEVFSEHFSALDLATGVVSAITPLQTTPAHAMEFLGGDFSTLYAFSGNASNNSFVTVDPATGATTGIGRALPEVGDAWSGLAADSSNGVLYASSVPYNGTEPCGGRSTLYRIYPETATAIRIGNIGDGTCIMGLATNANGELFGIDTDSDSLVAIDKTTGAGTVIGSLGFDTRTEQGLDFDEAANVLYLSTWNYDRVVGELRTVDTVTGASTWVADLSGSGQPWTRLTSLVLTSGGGGCVDPADIPWLSVSPEQGVLAVDQQALLTVTVDARGLAEGRHEALLCIHTNSPADRFVTVPVRVDVGNSLLFRNGFEE